LAHLLALKQNCINKEIINQSSKSHTLQGGPKNEYQFYFWNNFGNSAPILTILSLLQTEIYGA